MHGTFVAWGAVLTHSNHSPAHGRASKASSDLGGPRALIGEHRAAKGRHEPCNDALKRMNRIGEVLIKFEGSKEAAWHQRGLMTENGHNPLQTWSLGMI
jgi:hypothetical protein